MALPSQQELAYVGGYMDADGSFMINHGSRGYRIEALCSSVNPRVPQWLQDHWGGTLYQHPNFGPNSRPIWSWKVAQRAAEKFIKAALPHLDIKERQAELCLAYIDTPDEVLVREMRVLNKRGVK